MVKESSESSTCSPRPGWPQVLYLTRKASVSQSSAAVSPNCPASADRMRCSSLVFSHASATGTEATTRSRVGWASWCPAASQPPETAACSSHSLMSPSHSAAVATRVRCTAESLVGQWPGSGGSTSSGTRPTSTPCGGGGACAAPAAASAAETAVQQYSKAWSRSPPSPAATSKAARASSNLPTARSAMPRLCLVVASSGLARQAVDRACAAWSYSPCSCNSLPRRFHALPESGASSTARCSAAAAPSNSPSSASAPPM
mmetsp:Transcript_37553/g.120706  ORF Transcript_37553/g.120706 Transcript_37553/m.120706 type:complete len:259 (+) Transcript_37553:385-1161(+)